MDDFIRTGGGKSCPLCRKPLAPGPAKLFDLGYRKCMKIKGLIDLSSAVIDVADPWPDLSAEEQQDMDEAVAMMREAADQGHLRAQLYCRDAYLFGWGVVKNDLLAFVYNKKAAQQGDVECQFYAGVFCRDSFGCEQDYEEAAEWFEMAARQNYATAQAALGRLLWHGFGGGK